MLSQLSPSLAIILNEQLDKLIAAIKAKLDKNTAIIKQMKNTIISEVTDVESIFKYMQFDIEATKRERDELRSRLGE
jgi:hypothetical protein